MIGSPFNPEVIEAAMQALNAAGITGEDADTSLGGVLSLVAPDEYPQWRLDVGKLTHQQIAEQYGHDYSRAVSVLAMRPAASIGH